jgi:hypothetical protein
MAKVVDSFITFFLTCGYEVKPLTSNTNFTKITFVDDDDELVFYVDVKDQDIDDVLITKKEVGLKHICTRSESFDKLYNYLSDQYIGDDGEYQESIFYDRNTYDDDENFEDSRGDFLEDFRDGILQCKHIIKMSNSDDSKLIDNSSVDSLKLDSPKVDSPKLDSPKVDSPKLDSPKVDSPKLDSPKMDSQSFNIPNILEIPMVDTPPVDTPPVDTPPVDTPPVNTPPVDTPPVNTPVVDALPVDTPPVNTPVVNTPVVDTSPVDTPVIDIPQADTTGTNVSIPDSHTIDISVDDIANTNTNCLNRVNTPDVLKQIEESTNSSEEHQDQTQTNRFVIQSTQITNLAYFDNSEREEKTFDQSNMTHNGTKSKSISTSTSDNVNTYEKSSSIPSAYYSINDDSIDSDDNEDEDEDGNKTNGSNISNINNVTNIDNVRSSEPKNNVNDYLKKTSFIAAFTVVATIFLIKMLRR